MLDFLMLLLSIVLLTIHALIYLAPLLCVVILFFFLCAALGGK
ncbi:UNVERIFIED_ORG: hypothetical protein J2W74_001301 [Methylorubrum zatmanii]